MWPPWEPQDRHQDRQDERELAEDGPAPVAEEFPPERAGRTRAAADARCWQGLFFPPLLRFDDPMCLHRDTIARQANMGPADSNLERPRRWLFAFLAFTILTSCGEDDWTGHVYPDKDDLTRNEYLGKYPSLSECRSAAQTRINLFPDPARADYECGLNCELSDYGAFVCEETLR